MGAGNNSSDMIGRFLPILLLVIGLVAAGLVAGLPQMNLDLMVRRIGLPVLLPAATPPIGVVGRIILALLASLPFAIAALAIWQRKPRQQAIGHVTSEEEPVAVRRADAHPDARPRRPIRAAEDLGPPLPIIAAASDVRAAGNATRATVAEQATATHDPAIKVEEPEAVAPLAMSAAAAIEPVPPELLTYAAVVTAPPGVVGSEIAVTAPEPAPEIAVTIEAEAPRPPETPMPHQPRAASAPTPPLLTPAPATDTSIAALLERLEAGARERAAKATAPTAEPASSLDDTLGMLRRLASR